MVETRHEPSLTMNYLLQPIIEQLLRLEQDEFQSEGVTNKVILHSLTADDPALRKVLGLVGHRTPQGCPYCLHSGKTQSNFF
jgi:hypothetical protein